MPIRLALLLAALIATGAACAQAPAPDAPVREAHMLDSEVRLVLSDPRVLKVMYQVTSRFGMTLWGISKQREVGETLRYTITLKGGKSPEDSAVFQARVGPEGPPPVKTAVLAVTRPVIKLAEGPASL